MINLFVLYLVKITPGTFNAFNPAFGIQDIKIFINFVYVQTKYP